MREMTEEEIRMAAIEVALRIPHANQYNADDVVKNAKIIAEYIQGDD